MKKALSLLLALALSLSCTACSGDVYKRQEQQPEQQPEQF